MLYEEETDYSTTFYRCIDPIENFKIKIVIQPVKNLYIPLPQFDGEQSSPDLSPNQEEDQEKEEFIFRWQEKVFSRNEIKKYSDSVDWKKKITEKYSDNIKYTLSDLKDCSRKVFSYVEVDNYSSDDLDIFIENPKHITSLSRKFKDLKVVGSGFKNYSNIPKRKIINYYPSDEFRKQAHIINKNVEKMFIMIDLGSKIKEASKSEKEEEEEEVIERVLCLLSYDTVNSVLQMTPSFSKTESKPFVCGVQNESGRNLFYYWIFHASASIESKNLTKEILLMSKVFDYQEEVKKLQIDTDFFVGKANNIYTTLLGEIVSAQDFEYDNLHVHYFMKLPTGWGYSDVDSLLGRSQSSYKNSQGVCYFSHLFEMNFCLELDLFEDPSAAPLELFFEVLSIDKYKRYRNEGYTYISIPKTPGMHNYTLKCWRILDNTVKSQLERFFIGGGLELEDVSYIGLSTNENQQVMSRFGLKTLSSGLIEIKLNILHQSKNFTPKGELAESEKSISSRLDAGSLLGSVNSVLEAFRRARERMLQAKKGLQTNLNYTFPTVQNKIKKA